MARRRRYSRIVPSYTPTYTPAPVPVEHREPHVSNLEWTRGERVISTRFDSLADFVAKAESLPTLERATDTKRLEFLVGSYGTQEASHEAIRKGVVSEKTREKYFDTLAKLEPLIEKFSNQDGRSTRRKRVFSDSDGELNIDRYLDRKDDIWERSVRQQKRKLVSLGVNFWLSCVNTEDDFIGIASIAAAAADILQRLGYATEVKLCTVCQDGEKFVVTSFPVKEANEPLDVQNILQIANPGLFRSLYFAAHLDGLPDSYSKGSGCKHTQECKDIAGVDYLVTKEWVGNRQELTIEGMLSQIQLEDYASEQSFNALVSEE